MADIKITINSGDNNKVANSLGFVGDFARNPGQHVAVKTVAELHKYFGQNGSYDTRDAVELLENNIPLLIKGIDKNEEVSSLSSGTSAAVQGFDSSFQTKLNKNVDSFTDDDGITNIVDLPYTDLVNSYQAYTAVSVNVSVQATLTRYDDRVCLRIPVADTNTLSLNISDSYIISGFTGGYTALNGLVMFCTNRFTSNGLDHIYGIWVDATSLNGLRDIVSGVQNSWQSINAGGVIDQNAPITTVNFTGAAASAPTFQIGDMLLIGDSVIAANNGRVLTVTSITVDNSDLIISGNPDIAVSDDANAGAVSKVTYRDRSVITTATITGDYTPLFNTILNAGVTNVYSYAGATLNTISSVAETGGDTIFTFATNFPAPPTSLDVRFSVGNNTVIKHNTTPTLIMLVGRQYGFIDSVDNTQVTTAFVDSKIIIDGSYYFALDAVIPNTIDTILFAEGGAGIEIVTKTKGNNSDLMATLQTVLNGHLVTVLNSTTKTLLESWLLTTNFDAEVIDEMNSGLEIVTLVMDENSLLPSYFSGLFGGVTLTADSEQKLAAVASFSNIPVPAMFGDLSLEVGAYDFKFPKTVFINIPNTYTWTQAIATTKSYNAANSRNVHITYGSFNGLDLDIYAIKAFFKTALNGDALTQTKYAKLGYINDTKINTVLNKIQVADADDIGLVTMFSLNDNFSEYYLVNNTSPYRKAPLNRANTNFILNRLIWEVHSIELINKDKALNLALFSTINSQFIQLLANYAPFFEEANILDDSKAASLDELVYNTKADVLSGTYKVILELKFYNTLKKLSVEFIVS